MILVKILMFVKMWSEYLLHSTIVKHILALDIVIRKNLECRKGVKDLVKILLLGLDLITQSKSHVFTLNIIMKLRFWQELETCQGSKPYTNFEFGQILDSNQYVFISVIFHSQKLVFFHWLLILFGCQNFGKNLNRLNVYNLIQILNLAESRQVLSISLLLLFHNQQSFTVS